MKYPLSSGTPIPEDHAAQLALETGLPIARNDYIPFRSGRRMPAFVDAHPKTGSSTRCSR
jgi:hypothetical protein